MSGHTTFNKLPPDIQRELLARIRAGRQSRKKILAWLEKTGNGEAGMSYGTLGRISRKVRCVALVPFAQRENALAILRELDGLHEQESALQRMLKDVLGTG